MRHLRTVLLIGFGTIVVTGASLEPTSSTEALAAQTVRTYEYDSLNRLTRISIDAARTTTYAYDPVGNRLLGLVTDASVPFHALDGVPSPGWPGFLWPDPLSVAFSTWLNASSVAQPILNSGLGYWDGIEPALGAGGASLEISLSARPVAGDVLHLSIPVSVQALDGRTLVGPFTMRVAAGGLPSGMLLEKQPAYQSNRRPSGLGAIDVDRDGDVDLVTPLSSADSLAVLLNNGAGLFVPGPLVAAGDGCVAVAALDINRDGWIDLVTANFNEGTLSISRNNGSGQFLEPVKTNVGGSPFCVIVGDVDGDGWLDVVSAVWGTGSAPSRIAVCRNDSGVLAAPNWINLNGVRAAVRLLDLDADGRLDLVSCTSTPNELMIHRNVGGAVFTSGDPIGTALPIEGLATGDFDLDGLEDVVGVSEANGGFVGIYRSNGATLEFDRAVPMGIGSAYIEVADLDGDGHLDLAAAQNEQSGTVRIVLNPVGGVSDQRRIEVPAPFGPPQARDTRLVDLNGDGLLDVAVALRGGVVQVMLAGQSTTGVPVDATNAPRQLSVRAIQATDGAVHLEIVVPYVGNGSLDVFDVAGRLIASPWRRADVDIGMHRISWDRRDRSGARMKPGVYLLRLSVDAAVSTAKLVLIE